MRFSERQYNRVRQRPAIEVLGKSEVKKVYYPALADKDEDSDFCVSFPDFPGCVSAGETLEEAVPECVRKSAKRFSDKTHGKSKT